MDLSFLFKAAIEASWQASIIILLILLVRPVFGMRVPARWRSWLWALALLRLLVPAFLLPSSPASLQNLDLVDRPLDQVATAVGKTTTTAARENLVAQGPIGAEGELPPMAPPTDNSSPVMWWKLAGLVWLAGAGLSASWVIIGMILLQRRIREDSGEVDEEVLQVWRRCCARLSLRRAPRLIATDCVESPALVGLFRPALLLPKSAPYKFSIEDWEHVFFHELAHFQRRDHWTHVVQLVALSAHWFNPLVWLGFRYLRADRELAADEWALRRLEDEQAVAYGDTLLKVLAAQSRQRMIPAVVGIMEDRAQLKQRLRHIVAFNPKRLMGSAVGLSVAILLSAVVLGRVSEPDLARFEGLSPEEILVSAARSGDVAVVKRMLADGADVNAIVRGRGERTPLIAAVAANQVTTAELLITHGADVNLAPEKADPPITVALKRGWREPINLLLRNGAKAGPEMIAVATGNTALLATYRTDQTADTDRLKTLCHIAAAHGHAEIFGMLHDAIRARPGQGSWEIGHGAAVVAASHGHRGILEEMMKRESGLNTGVIRFSAAAARVPGMREWLEERGFKVPEYTNGERLIDAAEREDLPEIRRLLMAGVDVQYRGESDWTPITKAATWGCPRAVKLLLEHGADPNTLKHHHPALRLAKTPAIADLLFTAGADVNARMSKEHIITYCVTFGPAEMVRWFLDHGVDPKTAKADGRSLLEDAGSAEIAKLLIEYGVSVKDSGNAQPILHYIAQYGKKPAETLRVLLQNGADPNERDSRGFTPLMAASDGASVDVLVEFGADLTAEAEGGHNVLNTHSHLADVSRLEALLRHGVEMDEKTGQYLLAHAAWSDQIDVVKYLLERGVDPNAPSPINPSTNSECRPLDNVISRGQLGIAKLLVQYGADATEHLPLAVQSGHPALVKLFWEHGARSISELCYAVTQSAPVSELDRILAKGTPVDPPEDHLITPLGAAAAMGNLPAVQHLLRRGAAPEAGQWSALDCAAEGAKDEVVAWLLDHGAKATPERLQALLIHSNPYPNEPPAARFTAIVKHMLAHGAADGITEEQTANILCAAVMTRYPGGNPAVVKALLDHGLNVHARTSKTVSFTRESLEGTTQSVLELARAAAKEGSWRVKPEVKALLEQAAASNR